MLIFLSMLYFQTVFIVTLATHRLISFKIYAHINQSNHHLNTIRLKCDIRRYAKTRLEIRTI